MCCCNTMINFVPQGERWVIERMGRFNRILEPGLNFLVPCLDTIAQRQSIKEVALDVPQQGAITLDNVQLVLDGVLYIRVIDPYKASYGVANAEFAVSQLAQTTMRCEVGKMSMETVFRDRETLNVSIVQTINKAAEDWGITCLRYEIRDMSMPPSIQDAMNMQAEAERSKRAAILESEGQREAAINVAEVQLAYRRQNAFQGLKRSRILSSEADEQQQVNRARGEATAEHLRAQARSAAIKQISAALQANGAQDAVSLQLAEQYVGAFSRIAQKGNTILMPADVGDPSAMIAQALTIYKNINVELV